jgi:hypothetical protein
MYWLFLTSNRRLQVQCVHVGLNRDSLSAPPEPQGPNRVQLGYWLSEWRIRCPPGAFLLPASPTNGCRRQAKGLARSLGKRGTRCVSGLKGGLLHRLHLTASQRCLDAVQVDLSLESTEGGAQACGQGSIDCVTINLPQVAEVVSRQVVEIHTHQPRVCSGVDAAAAVDGESTAHRRLENRRAGFPRASTPIVVMQSPPRSPGRSPTATVSSAAASTPR